MSGNPNLEGTAKRILVVEDDKPTRELLRYQLESAKYSVTTAADGVQALELLRQEPYDLVLLDVWMPEMTGLELLAHLRTESIRAKVIVMTSDKSPDTVLQSVRDQAYRYITKPVPRDELENLVNEALASPTVPKPIEVLSARPEWVELLVPCELEAAERIQGFLNHLKADLDQNVREEVGYAFRELLMNAIEWGGKLDPTRKVRISYLRGRRFLLYRIADPGKGFQFEGLTHAAVSNPVEQPLSHVAQREEKGLRPGGFGIKLVRGMADELLYNESHNEVVLIKYLD